MKRSILFLISLLFLACASPVETKNNDDFAHQTIDYQPKSVEEAWKWIAANIHYQKDPGEGLKRPPQETYRLRYGDCEDFALLLAYFAYRLNIETYVVIIKISDKQNHCCLKYREELIEPQIYNQTTKESWPDFSIVKEYSYEEAYYTNEIRCID